MTHIKNIIFFVTLLCISLKSYAQEYYNTLPNNRHTTHSTMFAVGKSHIYDTYLSPLDYSGMHLGIIRETLRKTHWAEGKVTTQGLFDGNFSYTKPEHQSSNELSFMLGYNQSWHYNWITASNRLRIMAGAGINGSLGAIYNTRNSNNPVQAKANLYLSASAMAIYNFNIRKQPMSLRYQISIPMIGAMFSPQYGQSYYEMSLGNYDNNICMMNPVKTPCMQHYITIDFPIGKLTFRAGYLCDIQQSKVNGIKSDINRHSFLIGYVKHFTFVHKKEPQHSVFVL